MKLTSERLEQIKKGAGPSAQECAAMVAEIQTSREPIPTPEGQGGGEEMEPCQCCGALPIDQVVSNKHPDDSAVDRFAVAMKSKLKWEREVRGRGGWDDRAIVSDEQLANMLIDHLSKGNPGTFEDIANFAMMLHQRNADPSLLSSPRVEEVRREALEEIERDIAHCNTVPHVFKILRKKRAALSLQVG